MDGITLGVCVYQKLALNISKPKVHFKKQLNIGVYGAHLFRSVWRKSKVGQVIFLILRKINTGTFKKQDWLGEKM